MGNGMMCATPPKTGVAQGSAKGRVAGAPPPPPPTGAVGGGGALHPCGVEVAQVAPVCPVPILNFPQWDPVGASGASVVPMPQHLRWGGVAGRAFPSTQTGGQAHG